MKELNIPYIGVKIEALPTILRKVDETTTDSAFIAYYENIGKAPKTASEYLASLRNLKLAKRRDKTKTVLLPAGSIMIQDDVQKLYTTLLQHCLKNFSDLRIVSAYINKNNTNSLPELVNGLQSLGYKIKRTQTLSSYLKLINEGGKKLSKRSAVQISKSFRLEHFEFNQFLKLLAAYIKKTSKNRIVLLDFYLWLNTKVGIERELFTDYLKAVRSMEQFSLIEVNKRVLKSEDDGFSMNGRIYYYLEYIK